MFSFIPLSMSLLKPHWRSIFILLTTGLVYFIPALCCAGDAQGTQSGLDKSPVGLVNILQVMTYLILVLLIIIGSAWVFRRYGRINAAANGHLKIISGLSVGQRERIVLVEAGDVQLLLGVAPGHVQTLHVMGDAAVEVTKDTGKTSFASRLNDEVRKKILS